ncbi:MAG: UDP-N-acetylmuramoyl-L-alanyl-D-glutamate--2,6-diaminopimelate ligase [Gammaproteobacteria bacterium]|nr:UDP-N-acetylmuramoyl-L-alanyl-D-glutamate--2,6-diaminopimelate ligase [Gammaproteobacteria bacterium]
MADLAYCLSGIVTPSFSAEFDRLVLDSRQVTNKDVFVALSGEEFDGHNFIQDALAKGVVAVLAEREIEKNDRVIVVPELRHYLSEIAGRFYGNPSSQMSVVGVTGTNGKSSITHFISQSLRECGRRCGIIGTLGYGFLPELISSTHTTPDAVNVQRILAELKKQGADSIAMEVSSHGLHQERVSGVSFETAVFTNLTRDHLDYHGTMEHYKAQKRRLFSMPNLKNAIINCDDPFGKEIVQSLSGQLNVVGYGLQNHTDVDCSMIIASNIRQNYKGFRAKIESPWGGGELRSQLLGQFNISNVLAVLGVLIVMGISLEEALEGINQVQTVTGRMQAYGGDKQALVVVDYAHTPDALQQALLALKPHAEGKLWCVFGCGGDRDRGKRPLMGQVAERYSDQLILTNDNPRSESPQTIIDEIKSGLLCPWAVEVELDRGAAIAHAIDCAEPGDVVLIAGKGHEAYQIMGDEKLPFSDIERVQHLTAEKRLRD